MNYFEWFEIPVSLKVDLQQVTRKFMEMQRKFHPDFHVGATEEDQQEMLEKTSELNKAYVMFKNPDATMMYFLQVKGYWSPDQKETLSPDFLMEMMDLNEKLEDGVDEEAAKREVLLKIDEQNQGIEGVMAKDLGEIQESDIKIMIGYLNQKKYLKRILDRLLN